MNTHTHKTQRRHTVSPSLQKDLRSREGLLPETGEDVPRRPPGVRTALSGEKIRDTVTVPPGHLYAPAGQGSRARPPRLLPNLTWPLNVSSMFGKVCTKSCTRTRL